MNEVERPQLPTAERFETSDWITAGRPGPTGTVRQAREQHFHRLFGEGRWRIRYLWQDKVIDRDAALVLYEEAYYQFFLRRPDLLDWLCRNARDVYDLTADDIRAGLDYRRQSGEATHLADIAIRRCLHRLGREFQGSRLHPVRGLTPTNESLDPGRVPFHEPEHLLRPRLGRGQVGSIDDFWQSNKVLQVHSEVSEQALREHLLRSLPRVEANTNRVAVLGGSFNPIHLGHLRVAQELLDLYGFARVIFVPNGNHYRKASLIDERHRARMLELALAGEPRFELCDFELGREQVVYTDATLRHLHTRLKTQLPQFQLFNVRGSDIIARMLRWDRLPDLLEFPTLVPVRSGFNAWERFGNNPTFRLFCDHFYLVPRDQEDGLSSTLVRDRIAAGGSPRFLVPDDVAEYIRQHRLYQSAP